MTYSPTQGSPDRSDVQSPRYNYGCWTAFRTGTYHFPPLSQVSEGRYDGDDYDTSNGAYGYNYDALTTYSSVTVHYNEANCTQYLNKTTSLSLVEGEASNQWGYSAVNCSIHNDVICELNGTQVKSCRLDIRMQAALTLAGCLIIKAVYMISVNVIARRKVKNQCLTFGDVIVASSLDSSLRIRNECLVNAGDGYRHRVNHTCHKHCKDPNPSATGDELGHCQKDKKFNIVDKAADLVHPVIAIKYKKSLISNLGVTAVLQMIILMFASLVMLGVSVMLAVFLGGRASWWTACCEDPGDARYQESCPAQDSSFCLAGRNAFLNEEFGGFGGFNSSVTLASLPPDSLQSEQLSFIISNGAQLIYSVLYLLLVYNLTLISMEHEWGKYEHKRHRPRCTIVRGDAFEQSYLLQLPRTVIFPLMAFSAVMHWLLGQAISTRETVWYDPAINSLHSKYDVRTFLPR